MIRDKHAGWGPIWAWYFRFVFHLLKNELLGSNGPKNWTKANCHAHKNKADESVPLHQRERIKHNTLVEGWCLMFSCCLIEVLVKPNQSNTIAPGRSCSLVQQPHMGRFGLGDFWILESLQHYLLADLDSSTELIPQNNTKPRWWYATIFYLAIYAQCISRFYCWLKKYVSTK